MNDVHICHYQKTTINQYMLIWLRIDMCTSVPAHRFRIRATCQARELFDPSYSPITIDKLLITALDEAPVVWISSGTDKGTGMGSVHLCLQSPRVLHLDSAYDLGLVVVLIWIEIKRGNSATQRFVTRQFVMPMKRCACRNQSVYFKLSAERKPIVQANFGDPLHYLGII